jgi:hypothetical protein
MATEPMTREDILKGIIEGMARRDAKLFVDEWNEPIDPSATDWDATAWGDNLSVLKRSNWTEVELNQDWLFPHYQAWLVSETERLVSEA